MRTPIRRALAGLSAAAALWILPGCDGGSAPSVDGSTTEATVKGVVKVDGTPATEGEIVFNPANNRRPNVAPRSAPIGKDGTYTVKTLTGENEVKLVGSLVKKNPVAGRSARVFNVKTGENTFDVDAKSGKK
jgi:hypothetical protein